MSWYEYIASKANDYAQQFKHAYEDLFPDWSKLPIVSNPVVLMVKGTDAMISGTVKASNDFKVRQLGYEQFSRLPEDYIAPDEQYSSDVQSHSIGVLIADYAAATAGNVADGLKAAAKTVTDAITPDAGAMPLWVKLTIAGTLVIGIVVAVQSLTTGRRYAS